MRKSFLLTHIDDILFCQNENLKYKFNTLKQAKMLTQKCYLELKREKKQYKLKTYKTYKLKLEKELKRLKKINKEWETI